MRLNDTLIPLKVGLLIQLNSESFYEWSQHGFDLHMKFSCMDLLLFFIPEHRNSLPESITGTPMSGSLATVSEEERRINEVLYHMWRYIHTYTMRFIEKVFKISKNLHPIKFHFYLYS